MRLALLFALVLGLSTPALAGRAVSGGGGGSLSQKGEGSRGGGQKKNKAKKTCEESCSEVSSGCHVPCQAGGVPGPECKQICKQAVLACLGQCKASKDPTAKHTPKPETPDYKAMAALPRPKMPAGAGKP